MLAVVACLGLAGAAMADGITNSADDLRTGWYPDEPSITPGLVSGNTFGQLWSANVDGQVYATPLLSPTGTQASPSGILVVATETDNVYGLDPVNGAQLWTKNLGTPFNPADIQCPDINPAVGTTSTPVIDTSTNTVYLTHKAYGADGTSVHWFMDALDVTTGQEKSGWPVELTTGSGFADNARVTFFPKTQQQRPGLLLMNGVVYAAFGSHCDVQPWQGWIFGVSTSTHSITAKWVDDPTTNGAGIWQGGTGLTSDGSGQILFGTGNGGAPSTPAPGNQVPASCGECMIRVQVQPNGSLKATDFFAPYDSATLDQSDGDFGSGALVGLPDQYFGTSAVPHLAVTVGKEGYVYLLNRDNLGGYDQGPGGGDNVVQRLGPRGGVYGRPGIWPGDGGYVYVTTSTGQSTGGLLDVYKYGTTSGTNGSPLLTMAGSASDVFGWGSGSPVITSDGTNSGSAVVWVYWSADRRGDGGQLRAYNPVPDSNGALQLLHAPWSIGTATNYTTPGVGEGRLYVGTRDGHVLGFGSPTPQPLGGSGLTFPRTTDGQSSSPQTLTMTASRTVTVSSLSASPGEFTLGTPSHSLPVTLNQGQTLSVPVTFTPGSGGTGLVAGQLTAGTTDAGDVSFSLSGTGQAATGLLLANPQFVSLGGTAVGGQLNGTVTFSNAGASALTIDSVDAPSAPFSATGVPAHGTTIAPGGSVNIEISFDSSSVGQYTDAVSLNTTDGESQTVQISASASPPGLLQLSSEAVDFGTVTIGDTVSRTFTIKNVGGTPVTINKSKPPFGGAFAATTSLQEGTTIDPGQSVSETVTFSPTSSGPASATWPITGDDSSGPHQVQFTGTGATPGLLQGSPPSLALGDVAVGGHLSGKVTFSNGGGQPLTVDSVASPSVPFSVTGAPLHGDTIGAGNSVTVNVSFDPTAPGQFSDAITLKTTDGQEQTIRLLASTPGTGASASTAGPPSTTGVPPATTSTTPTPPRVTKTPKAPEFTSGVTTTANLAGTYITYNAMTAGVSRFVLQRATSGRRSAHGCVAVTVRNRSRASCTRYVVVKAFTHHDRAGANRLRLGAYVALQKLPAGSYRLQAVLLDSAGKKHTFYTQLRVITPPRRDHAKRAIVFVPLEGLLARLDSLL